MVVRSSVSIAACWLTTRGSESVRSAAGVTPAPFRIAVLSSDLAGSNNNMGAAITKSVGSILQPLCAHRDRNVVHNTPQAKVTGTPLPWRGMGGRLTRSLFGRQSKLNWPAFAVGTTTFRPPLTQRGGCYPCRSESQTKNWRSSASLGAAFEEVGEFLASCVDPLF